MLQTGDNLYHASVPSSKRNIQNKVMVGIKSLTQSQISVPPDVFEGSNPLPTMIDRLKTSANYDQRLNQ